VTELQATAARALQLAALDPAGARAVCTSVLEPARRDQAWDVVCIAERALGVASMTLNEIDSAISHLRRAVEAGQRAASPSGAGEARMSLASALVLRGLPAEASREIETAVHDLGGVPAARAHVQHAAILQELGQDDAAFDELRRALPVLRRARDAEWAARALSNRSLMYVGRRAFGAAEADLIAARQLCVEHHLELPAGYAEQNLGCVKAQRGDVPAALRLFDAAEERYRRFGLVEASLFLDRAGVLLSVRLLDEARDSAEAAVAAYEEQKRDVHLPEAQLMVSTVALLQGDSVTAGANAREAVKGFRRLGHAHSLALARYATIQAMLAADPDGIGPAKVARSADELEAAGWTVPGLEARVLAGRMALDRGQRAAARRHLSLASKARMVGPADARSRAWLAEALLRRADGRRTAAQAALRAGLRIVEDHQATLGATELRAHVSLHRGALARWGLRMALEDRDPRRVWWWAERGRASALLLPPAHPSEDPELAQDLADLRSTMAEIEQVRNDAEDDEALLRRQVVLERRIRDRCRTLEGGDTDRRSRNGRSARNAESVTELTAPLGDAALLEFVEVDGDVHAVTVAGGRLRLQTLGPMKAISDVLRQVPFALRRLARPYTDLSDRKDAATATLQRATAHLDDLLLRPLASELQDRPLVIVPTGALQSLPWSILPSCISRPVTVSPSAALWHKAVTRRSPPNVASVVLVAGPGLPGAATEASTIAGLYPDSTLLRGEAATVAALTASLEGAAMLHLAAHSQLRSDNPLFSSLMLADGPFTVYEIERLARPPHHVVLAACETGRLQMVAGEEIIGIGAALLGGGTATFVAPLIPIPDMATVPLMRSYHEGLLMDRSPADALAQAQAQVDKADAAGRAAAAGFVCLGAG